ncbi:hypothetical protein ILYODFUR_007170 [Ilyodon furcidens]|uniref:Uncharacterized protein n=1 Tax=Ilyodon furcidens TaxID=33524 RepID=A0ABV0TSN3_9TELE
MNDVTFELSRQAHFYSSHECCMFFIQAVPVLLIEEFACSLQIPALIFTERHVMTKPFKFVFSPLIPDLSLHHQALRGSHHNPARVYYTSIFFLQLREKMLC